MPSPFCTLATAASANTSAHAATAARVCSALVATMPSEHGGTSAADVRAWTGATKETRPVTRSPCSLIAATWSARGSIAHTSTSPRRARCAAYSDPIAPQPTTQTRVVMRS